jgi:predicted lipoprotein with Yx(FWY)xxD motif
MSDAGPSRDLRNPLFFARDKKAGDVNGQGFVHFGGAWWVVSAAGKKITVKP